MVATVLDSADIEHFHHHRKFYWTALAEGTDPYSGTDENSKARLDAPQSPSLPCSVSQPMCSLLPLQQQKAMGEWETGCSLFKTM